MVVDSKPKRRALNEEFFLTNSLYIVIAILVVALSFTSDKYLTVKNIVSIFNQSSILMIVTTGMALCIITKGIDMSVGGLIFLAGAVMFWAGKQGFPLVVVGICGVASATALGVINGVIAANFRIYPLLSTLATMNVARGIGMMITRGSSALMPRGWSDIAQKKIGVIPLMFIIAIAIGVITQIFLSNTKLGRHIFAVGDDEKTAHEKGLSIKGVKIFVYTASGFLCGIAAIISTSQVMAAPATMGQGQDFYCIIAAVLGGCSLFGGKGSIVPGVLIGSLIMSIISNSLVIIKAEPNLYSIVYALVIFIVVLLDAVKAKRIKI